MKIINKGKIPIKMWLNDIEQGAIEQAINISNLPFAFKHIAIMPDSHQGFGMPIGGVLATENVIIPNCVGVDIGCGMMAVKTSLKEIDVELLKKFMGEIRKVVPLGFKKHKEKQEWEGFDNAPDIKVIQDELSNARYSLGTLGGGNHFIEIQKGDDGNIWIMLHSGSRNFGLKIATEYHKKALKLCEKWKSDLPSKELAFLPLDTKEGKEYKEAMEFALEFALANRRLMMRRVTQVIADNIPQTGFTKEVNIHHNYASIENHFGRNVIVHRKGATKATKKTIGIIPGSMGSSSYIVQGKGNPESFMSCSHGAGRKMSRSQARKTLNLEDEQRKMKGVIGKPRGQKDLDEAPGSYKDIDTVMDNQKDLVDIKVRLRPLASIKG